jgi:hypothetical protein
VTLGLAAGVLAGCEALLGLGDPSLLETTPSSGGAGGGGATGGGTSGAAGGTGGATGGGGAGGAVCGNGIAEKGELCFPDEAQAMIPIAGAGLRDVTLVDCDGDGDLDIVVLASSNDKVFVLRNEGNRVFFNVPPFSVPSNAEALAFVDPGGKPPSHMVTVHGKSGASLVIQPWQSSCTPADAPVLAPVGPAHDFVVTEIGNGGSVDFVATRPDARKLALVDGDNPALAPKVEDTFMGALAIAAGDLDGVGAHDLVYAFADEVVVRRVINGTIAANEERYALDKIAGIALADMDGTGTLDIVVTLWEANKVVVLLNDGKGGFDQKSIADIADASVVTAKKPEGVATGDLDRDGNIDVVTANSAETLPNGSTVSVLLNDGKGTVAPATMSGFPDVVIETASPYKVAAGSASVAVGDLDGDGALDIVVASETSSLGAEVSILFAEP